jgi:hypothetical protein
MRNATCIFIVGASRSGTTMLAHVLGRHPDICYFHELHFFEELWPGGNGMVPREQAASMVAELLARQRDGYLNNPQAARCMAEASAAVAALPAEIPGVEALFLALDHETRRSGKVIPCEQTPRNVFYIADILAARPGARIIVMLRDPRDVVLSQKGKWRRRFLGGNAGKTVPLRETLRTWFNYHPAVIARLWAAAAAAAGRHARDPRVLRVRFEDLVGDPQAQVSRICEFVGVAYRPDMLRVPRVGSSHLADGHESATGIDSAAAGNWRRGGLARAEIDLTEWVAGEQMAACGYLPGAAKRPGLAALLLLMVLPFKLGVSLLLNLGRMKNIIATIRKRLTS